jgi:hypothetical protein
LTLSPIAAKFASNADDFPSIQLISPPKNEVKEGANLRDTTALAFLPSVKE